MSFVLFKAGLVDVDLTLPIQVAIFLVFYFLLRYALFAPVLLILSEREGRVATARQESETLENSTATRIALYETKLKEARARAFQERDAIRADGARLERELLAKVRSEVAAKADDARAGLSRAVEAAKASLAAEQRSIAIMLVDLLVGRKTERRS